MLCCPAELFWFARPFLLMVSLKDVDWSSVYMYEGKTVILERNVRGVGVAAPPLNPVQH